MRRQTKKRTTVLIVEQGTEFGGSLVSTALLTRCVDHDHFRIVIAMAADPHLLVDRLGETAANVEVLQVRPLMHYGRMAALLNLVRKLPGHWIQRGALLVVQLARFAGNLPWALKIMWIHRTRDVDLVQFNNGFGNEELVLISGVMRSRPIVFLRGYMDPMGTIARKLLLPRLRSCVSVSEFVKQAAVKDGVPEEIITVATPPAIPSSDEHSGTSPVAVRGRYGISEQAFVVGVFGRIVRWKGQLEVVQAMAPILKENDHAVLLIVGDESDGGHDYTAEVESVTRQEGVADQVVFTGYVDDVDDHYRAVDLVIHASIKPEPSGRVVFEAMSNQAPLIVSSLGGPKEFITDGEDGFVVDPRDAERLRAAVERFVREPELGPRMAERALHALHARYGPEVYGKKVTEAYHAALDLPQS